MSLPLRVLLVEDEFLIALDFELLLQSEGHEVIGIAAHVESALALARAHKPDLALVDVNLKDGPTGPKIAEYLTQALGVPVLFVTGSRDQLCGDFRGALGLLEKPVSTGAFLLTIRYLAARIRGENMPTTPAGLALFGQCAEAHQVRRSAVAA